jgi:glycerol dehydrogenase-like iron-containing ADH family enzyme
LHQTAAAAAHAFCASTEGLKMEPYHGQCVVAITAALALENEVPDRYLAELRTM